MALKEFLNKVLKNNEDVPEHFVNDGSTGTELFSGYFQEEYLNTFQSMPEGIETYDKMRRSDYQVQMLLSAVKNPIIAANWGVEAVDNSDEEVEIADFVKYCIFDNMGYTDGSKNKSWREFLTEALTAIDFGYSLFEPVYKVVMNDPIWGNYIGIRDIGYRSQKTIYEWNLNKNGSIKTVRQLAQGDLAVDEQIPGANLMPITFKKEGDNYEGISMLRPIYGNWLRKNFYFKVQAMGIERAATGILTGTVPASAANDADQMTKFKNILRCYTSHQSTYILKPEGFEIDITKIDFDADDVEKAIDSEDRRMSKSFLAGFLELGMGGQSGVNLGKDLSTIFLNGIEIYSETIADAVEKTIVKKLVDAKFGKRQKYPQIKATDINNKGGKERAEVAVMLKNAGIISESEQLEDSMNRDFDFPVISPEQKEERAAKAAEKQRLETEKLDKQNLAKQVVVEKPAKEKVKLSEAAQFASDDNPTLFIRNRAKNVHMLMETGLVSRTNAYLEKITKQFNKETNVAKRRKILESTPIPGRKDYRNKLRVELARISEESTRRVLKELGMQNVKFDEFTEILKSVPFAMRDKLRADIEQIVNSQDEELNKRMFFVASQKLDTTDSVDSLIKDMKEAAEKYTVTSGVLNTAATNAVSGDVNSTRNAVFQTPEVFEEIESFIIVNPSPDAPICKNLAGRVFSKEEYKTQDLPPYHHNCETTVRAQLKGQSNIKPVNPIGLAPTGTEEQVASIIKSKTFDDSMDKEAHNKAIVDDLTKTIETKNKEIKELQEANKINNDNLLKAITGEA
jgi:hypothetical protein